MNRKPNEDIIRTPIGKSLIGNRNMIDTLLSAELNQDLQYREFRCGRLDVCIYYMDGLANEDRICDFIVRALQRADPIERGDSAADMILNRFAQIAQIQKASCFSEVIPPLLAGKTCLLIDGCGTALIMDTLNQPHRSIEKPSAESIIRGSHEGFTEHLRTNVSLVRRYVQSEYLIGERMQVGTGIKRSITIMYLRDVASKECVAELKRRILCITADSVSSIGALAQLIEDHPYTVMPQILQTERPDRTAACLESGQIAVLMENSPYALILPITVFHLLHSSDDSNLRWQYGSMMRVVRLFGIVISLLLPALYIAVTLYHTHLLPMALLTSIAETRANVPFPIVAEVLFMECSFYLLNEAGMRMPRQIGAALGIVGALILGQAAVTASVISPILIIIIALTGLGNYAIPDYEFGMGIVIYRNLLILLSTFLGMYGVVIGLFFIAVQLCSIKSFGIMYFSPVAPYRRHNPDIILRLPVWLQRRAMYFASNRSWMGE